jgi:non-ribosomal peptide synthetase component F
MSVNAPFGEGALAPFSVLLGSEVAYRNSAAFAADRDFWSGVFSERTEAVSLSGRHRVPVLLPRSMNRNVEALSPAWSASLKSAARHLRTSLSGLMISAAATYVHRATGARDVVVGVPVTGRNGSAERRAPGMMSNVLLVRLAVHPELSLDELVRQVSATVRRAMRHRRYPHEDILRNLRINGRKNLFSVLVNVMSFESGIKFGDCGVTTHDISVPHVNDLSICVYDRSADGHIEIAFDANPELYTEESNRSNAYGFRIVLEWIANAAPSIRTALCDL